MTTFGKLLILCFALILTYFSRIFDIKLALSKAGDSITYRQAGYTLFIMTGYNLHYLFRTGKKGDWAGFKTYFYLETAGNSHLVALVAAMYGIASRGLKNHGLVFFLDNPAEYTQLSINNRLTVTDEFESWIQQIVSKSYDHRYSFSRILFPKRSTVEH